MHKRDTQVFCERIHNAAIEQFPERLQRLREKQQRSRRVVSELCGLPSDAVRRYERGEAKPSYEALIALSNGKAAKIIVPSDVVDMTKANVVFAETAGLGDVTKPSADDAKPNKKPDPCCD